MDKSHFKEDTRYTVTWRDTATGKTRPANFHVLRTYEKFMIVRETSGGGLLRKIAYEDIERIVQEMPVDPAHRYKVPAALLDEKLWRDRSLMEHYFSSPALGK